MRNQIVPPALFVVLLLSMLFPAYGQNTIGGIGGHPSAILDLQSTDRGLLPPRMTSAQRDAISSPAEGLLLYNTTLGCLQINLGTGGTANWSCMVIGLSAVELSVLKEILEDSGSSGGASNANGQAVSLQQLQLLSLTGINPDYLQAYQEAIQAEMGFSEPPAVLQVQMIINAVNMTIAAVLAEVQEDSDSPGGANNANGTPVSLAQLQLLPLTAVNPDYILAYQAAIQAETGFSNPPTLSELQAVVDAVNTQISGILTQIGDEGDAPDNVSAVVTAAQLSSLPVTGVVPSNELAYQFYIDNNPNSFSAPATIAEVQAMLTAVNSAVAGVMTEILEDSNSPGGAGNANGTAVSLAQLQSLPLDGVNPAYISNYQAAINAATGFSNLPTIAEVQAIIDAVNAAAGTISTLDCAGATTTGTVRSGQAASGLSTSVPYSGGNGGFYNGQTVNSTGVTGLTATLTAGTFASGSGNLSYAITGTPSGAGTASFALSIGGQSCTLELTVAINPGILLAGSGTFTGRTCFDIALSNDNTNSCALLSNRLAQQADFTNAATHTQQYTFTPPGTVSNVRFAYINTNGEVVTGLSGGNSGNNISTAVTATVNYNTNLNSLALGLTNSNPLTVDIYVIYNDGASNDGTDRQLKLSAKVKDCVCCGAFMASGVWRDFMCHNLGADESADPFTPSWRLNGNYYQWGRNPTCFGRDGVDAANPCSSPVYGVAAPWGSTMANDNAGGITGWNLNAAANGAWSDGSKTVNDPCPAGWRVPTSAQLAALINNTLNPRTLVGNWNWGTTNYSSGLRFGQSLYLPAAGSRPPGNFNTPRAELIERSVFGYYWSSTAISGPNAQLMSFTTVPPILFGGVHTNGLSVRCIAE